MRTARCLARLAGQGQRRAAAAWVDAAAGVELSPNAGLIAGTGVNALVTNFAFLDLDALHDRAEAEAEEGEEDTPAAPRKRRTLFAHRRTPAEGRDDAAAARALAQGRRASRHAPPAHRLKTFTRLWQRLRDEEGYQLAVLCAAEACRLCVACGVPGDGVAVFEAAVAAGVPLAAPLVFGVAECYALLGRFEDVAACRRFAKTLAGVDRSAWRTLAELHVAALERHLEGEAAAARHEAVYQPALQHFARTAKTTTDEQPNEQPAYAPPVPVPPPSHAVRSKVQNALRGATFMLQDFPDLLPRLLPLCDSVGEAEKVGKRWMEDHRAKAKARERAKARTEARGLRPQAEPQSTRQVRTAITAGLIVLCGRLGRQEARRGQALYAEAAGADAGAVPAAERAVLLSALLELQACGGHLGVCETFDGLGPQQRTTRHVTLMLQGVAEAARRGKPRALAVADRLVREAAGRDRPGKAGGGGGGGQRFTVQQYVSLLEVYAACGPSAGAARVAGVLGLAAAQRVSLTATVAGNHALLLCAYHLDRSRSEPSTVSVGGMSARGLWRDAAQIAAEVPASLVPHRSLESILRHRACEAAAPSRAKKGLTDKSAARLLKRCLEAERGAADAGWGEFRRLWAETTSRGAVGVRCAEVAMWFYTEQQRLDLAVNLFSQFTATTPPSLAMLRVLSVCYAYAEDLRGARAVWSFVADSPFTLQKRKLVWFAARTLECLTHVTITRVRRLHERLLTDFDCPTDTASEERAIRRAAAEMAESIVDQAGGTLRARVKQLGLAPTGKELRALANPLFVFYEKQGRHEHMLSLCRDLVRHCANLGDKGEGELYYKLGLELARVHKHLRRKTGKDYLTKLHREALHLRAAVGDYVGCDAITRELEGVDGFVLSRYAEAVAVHALRECTPDTGRELYEKLQERMEVLCAQMKRIHRWDSSAKGIKRFLSSWLKVHAARGDTEGLRARMQLQAELHLKGFAREEELAMLQCQLRRGEASLAVDTSRRIRLLPDGPCPHPLDIPDILERDTELHGRESKQSRENNMREENTVLEMIEPQR